MFFFFCSNTQIDGSVITTQRLNRLYDSVRKWLVIPIKTIFAAFPFIQKRFPLNRTTRVYIWLCIAGGSIFPLIKYSIIILYGVSCSRYHWGLSWTEVYFQFEQNLSRIYQWNVVEKLNAVKFVLVLRWFTDQLLSRSYEFQTEIVIAFH